MILKIIIVVFGGIGVLNTAAAIMDRLQYQVEHYEVAQKHPGVFMAFIALCTFAMVAMLHYFI